MNFLTTFFEQDSLNRWSTLALTQLWQVTLLIIVIGLLVKIFCRHRPHVAYLLWLVVIAKCLTPPLWSSPTSPFSWLLREPVNETVMIVPAETKPHPAMNRRESTRPRLPIAFDEPETNVVPEKLAPIASSTFEIKSHHLVLGCMIVWIVGCITISAAIFWKWLTYRRFLKLSTIESSSELRNQLAELSQQLGVRRMARVHCVDAACCPSLFGVFHPRIVLPTSITQNSNADELQPILAHELIHIRRGDLAVSYLQLLIQTLYWFHPLVWWANREMRRERERCCDEEVVAALNLEPKKYANLLVSLLESIKQSRARFAPAGVTMFGFTKRRLEHLIRRDAKFRDRTPKIYWLAIVVAFAIVLPGSGLAQSKAVKKITGDESAANRISPDTISKLKGDIQLEHIEALDITVVRGHPDDVALVTKDLQKEETKKKPTGAFASSNSAQEVELDDFEGHIFNLEMWRPNTKNPNPPTISEDDTAAHKAAVTELTKQGCTFRPNVDANGKRNLTAFISTDWQDLDANWKLLRDVTNFRGIMLSDNAIKKENLQKLSTLPDLKEINLGITSDDYFAAIPQLPNLTGLVISGSQYTNQTVAAIGERFPSLQRLTIAGEPVLSAYQNPQTTPKPHPSPLDDESVKAIKNLPQLISLSLHFLPKMTGRSLSELVVNKNLSEISVDLQNFNDEGLKSLSQLSQVKKIKLEGGKVTSAGFASLGAMTNLELLTISEAKNFDDAAAANLSPLKNLRWLWLMNMHANLTEKGLASIKDQKNLRNFHLSNWGTPYELAFLKDLTETQSISLHGLMINDKSMESFKQLKNVRHLQFTGPTDVGNDSLKNISQMTKLQSLHLSSPRLTDDCLVHLKEMRELTHLNLQACNITGNGFVNLANMSKLKFLMSSQCPIEDSSMKALLKLPQLSQLWLSNSKLTDSSVDELVQIDNLKILNLSGSQITDKGAERFTKSKSLEFLQLDRTKVTDECVARMKKTAPKLHVTNGRDAGTLLFETAPRNPEKTEPKGDAEKAKPANEKKTEQTSSNDDADLFGGMISHLESYGFLFGMNMNHPRLKAPDLAELRKQEVNFTLGKDKQGKPFVVAYINQWRESDAGWKQLIQIPDLQGLHVSLTGMKKESLARIGELPALRELIISNATDEQFAAIPQIKTLTGMSLIGSSFTDKTLAKLSEMKSLELLLLANFPDDPKATSAVTDDGLANLAKLTNLRTLNIQGFQASNGKFLENLAGLKNLSQMELMLASLNDEGMKSLVKLKQLKKLSLSPFNSPPKTTSSGLQLLGEMENLSSLTMAIGQNIDDRTIEQIGRLKNLRYLALMFMSNKLSGKGLAPLKNLSELRSVTITFDRSEVSLLDLEFLKDLQNLHTVMIGEAIVNNQGMSHLKNLINLKQLSLTNGINLTDESLKNLINMKKLEVIHIDAPGLTDDCLTHLKDLSSLVSISFSSKKIAGKGFESWPQMPRLRFISLYNAPIEDKYAKEFLKFPKLEQLNLQSSKLSDDAVEDLSQLPAVKKLELNSSGISDKEIEKFARIKSLTFIDLQNTKVTEAGAEKLRKLHPKLLARVKEPSNGTLTFSATFSGYVDGEFQSDIGGETEIELGENDKVKKKSDSQKAPNEFRPK